MAAAWRTRQQLAVSMLQAIKVHLLLLQQVPLVAVAKALHPTIIACISGATM